MVLTNKQYDALKYTAQIILPALASLVFGLAQIWGFPYASQIVGTIVLLDTFLGALLEINSANYKLAQLKEASENDLPK